MVPHFVLIDHVAYIITKHRLSTFSAVSEIKRSSDSNGFSYSWMLVSFCCWFVLVVNFMPMVLWHVLKLMLLN